MSGRGHHHGGGGIVARYDRDAAAYGARWGIVLAPAGLRLIERVITEGRPAASGIALDVGTGTGTLALALRRRLPGWTVIGADPSAGMLRKARAEAAAAGHADDARLRFVHAPADRVDLPDGALDLVIGAFVHQLVPDRPAAWRETIRLLRPGGHLALVTWRAGAMPPAAAAAFDDVVVDLGLDGRVAAEPHDGRSGDLASPRAAAAELRRAGFRRGAAREDRLTWRWTPAAYLELKLGYEEAALVAALEPDARDALARTAAERFARLPERAFAWDVPLVSVLARRP